MRRTLLDERRAITHKFSIGGHEGYVTVGIYDGAPGEIFITMAKEGSTISGKLRAMIFSGRGGPLIDHHRDFWAWTSCGRTAANWRSRG
ncbi:MAG: hypothetical protein ACLPY2_27880 [Bryobacteraceae bacterium]